jgi:hypothetical protein
MPMSILLLIRIRWVCSNHTRSFQFLPLHPLLEERHLEVLSTECEPKNRIASTR